MGKLEYELGKAVLLFQERFLTGSTTGSLCQVWLPESSEGSGTVLRTKGHPFCVAGLGDLLALFRCVSCRYSFSTDLAVPESLGAPGRVFVTMKPEVSSNVQKESKDVYLRADEALQCRVQSTCVVPIFEDPSKQKSVAVLEVVQFSQDMHFHSVVQMLVEVLHQCGLHTSESVMAMEESVSVVKRSAVQAQNALQAMSVSTDAQSGPQSPSLAASPNHSHYTSHPANQGELLSLPPVLQQAWDLSNAADRTSSLQISRQERQAVVEPNQTQRGPRKASQPPSTEDDDVYMEEGEEEEEEEEVEEEEAQGKGRRKMRGLGNPGKPGKRLKLEDLQELFGLGLKEAANRLGICPTTLKRACRRHGIQRWPRRQLLKLSRAIDQINSVNVPTDGAKPGDASGRQPLPTPDTRWSALAALIPTSQAPEEGLPHHSLSLEERLVGTDADWQGMGPDSHEALGFPTAGTHVPYLPPGALLGSDYGTFGDYGMLSDRSSSLPHHTPVFPTSLSLGAKENGLGPL